MFRVRFRWRRERIKRKLQRHPRYPNERGFVGKKTWKMELPPVWRSISDVKGFLFNAGS